MGTSNEGLVLAALEQAEMAARERRLAASNEAEAIISAARRRATEISASADRRVTAALEVLRQDAERAADAAIEDLQASAAREPRTSSRTGQAGHEQVVSFVVARVLAETPAGGGGEERS